MSEKIYVNYYRCEACDIEWQDEWDCACNDKCPQCHKEIEPYKSDEVVAFPMPDRAGAVGQLYQLLEQLKPLDPGSYSAATTTAMCAKPISQQIAFVKSALADATLSEFAVNAVKPVNIVLTEGCVASNITANGRPLYGERGMDAVELRQLADYLLSRLSGAINDGTVSVQQLIELFQYDRYENDGTPCEQCGDTVGRTYYTI